MPIQEQRTLRGARAGAVSGAAWFGLLLVLDGGWAIPTRSALGLACSLGAAVATGVIILHLFQSAFRRLRGVGFAVLPLATLPVAILVYSVLLWGARRVSGAQFEPPISAAAEFALILSTYTFYGMLSIVTPLLLLLAYLNQRWVRSRLQGRAA